VIGSNKKTKEAALGAAFFVWRNNTLLNMVMIEYVSSILDNGH